MLFSCQYFANSISRLLLPVDGAHAATCEEMAAAMSSAESSACQGLHQCIEIVISEVSIITLSCINFLKCAKELCLLSYCINVFQNAIFSLDF